MRWCWVNFQCRGVLLLRKIVGQGPSALVVSAGGGCLNIFSLVYHFSFLSPSHWETTRYRLNYCLKGPLSPKQPTNQPTRSSQPSKKNIKCASTSYSRLRYSCPNWHVTSLFELYLCFVAGLVPYKFLVAGHVPYKFQRNPISSIRNYNSWPNANIYLNVHHHINMYSLT